MREDSVGFLLEVGDSFGGVSLRSFGVRVGVEDQAALVREDDDSVTAADLMLVGDSIYVAGNHVEL